MFQKIKILWQVIVMVFKLLVTEVKGMRQLVSGFPLTLIGALTLSPCGLVTEGRSFDASWGSRQITTATLMFYRIFTNAFRIL